jgi:hypothetical protein
MPSTAIVECNVVLDFSGRYFPVSVDLLLDPLLLKTGKERFDDRVVSTISFSAHAGLESIGEAEPPPCVTPKL